MCKLIEDPYFTPLITSNNKSIILGFNGLCYIFMEYMVYKLIIYMNHNIYNKDI